jgi:hypothetical protein
MLKIYLGDGVIEDCTSVIIIPEKAIAEPGYIQTLTNSNDASSKHEFHAMAQTTYFQYQDDELLVHPTTGTIRVESGDYKDTQSKAMIVYRDNAGGLHAYIHQGLPAKKFLETAYRFCARWVRLDL